MLIPGAILLYETCYVSGNLDLDCSICNKVGCIRKRNMTTVQKADRIGDDTILLEVSPVYSCTKGMLKGSMMSPITVHWSKNGTRSLRCGLVRKSRTRSK